MEDSGADGATPPAVQQAALRQFGFLTNESCEHCLGDDAPLRNGKCFMCTIAAAIVNGLRDSRPTPQERAQWQSMLAQLWHSIENSES